MGQEEQLPVMSPSEHPFPEDQAYVTADFTSLLVSVSWGSALLRGQGSRGGFRNLLEYLNLHLENVHLGMRRKGLTEEAMGEMGSL